MALAPEHQCSLCLNFLKIISYWFQKYLKIIQNIVDVVSHKHVKSRHEILCIMGYTKMTNLIKFGDLKHASTDRYFCYFFYSSGFKVFEIDILHICGIIRGLHQDIFFNFFETHK